MRKALLIALLSRIVTALQVNFFVPKSQFIPLWNEHPEDYETIAKRFKVSEYVIYRIALEHGYITQNSIS